MSDTIRDVIGMALQGDRYVVRWLLLVVLLATGCAPRAAAPSASAPAIVSASPSAAPRTSSPALTPPPSAATGGIEVFATGALHGTYVWAVVEEPAPQDRVTEALYSVPLDGAAARLVFRRLRPQAGQNQGGYTVTGIVPDRQMTHDGTKLVLEQAPLGPAAHDGLIVVDLAGGTIREVARGDQRGDVMPAWSPDGERIAYARRNPGAPPVAQDDGLWLIAADGSGLRQLQPAAQFAQATYVFGWTPDGRGVAFGLAFEGVGYSVADVATGSVSGWPGYVFGLAPASWRARTPQLAIAFSEGDKGGTQRIQVADGVGAPMRTIASEEPRDQGMPLFLNARWGRAGDDVLFIRADRQRTLMRAGLTGGALAVATDAEPLRAEWLPDGAIVYTTAAGLSVARAGQAAPFWSPPAGRLVDLAVRTYP